MKKIVITGALGHIGSYLIRVLPSLDKGCEIIMIDNLASQRYCSLFDLPQYGKYRFIEGDILTSDLPGIFSGSDVVIHLAAITDAANSFDHAEELMQVNYGGTKKVANACCKVSVPLIFISTTSVYGTQKEIVDESCGKEDLKPQSPYAESKLLAEEYLKEMGETEGLDYIICRFGTIFGPSNGMRFHTAVNKFCWQAVNQKPITVWKTALNQKRPYLDLIDASKAIIFIINNMYFPRDIFNILSSNNTVEEIITIIKREIPTLEVKFVENQIMNQLSYTVSDKKIRDLGFTSEGLIDEGIHNTLQLLKGLF
jgi:UDP-glucose 4-epimerase